MKKIFLIILLFTIYYLPAQTLVKAWTTGKVLEVPESAFYDAASGNIYISNIAGAPSEKNGKGFISVLDTDGNIKNLHWADGLNAPKGITIFRGKFYVTDINEVVVIDLKSGKIIQKILVSGARFLNDITHDNRGRLYISDTQTDIIYRITNSRAEPWLFNEPLLTRPNGMNTLNGQILIGTTKGILAVNPDTKTIKHLVHHQGLIDGLIPLANNRFVISNWENKIEIVTANYSKELWTNSGKDIYAADLGYVPEKNLLLVPTFYDNRILAFYIKY